MQHSLKSLRLRKGLSQESLAHSLGLDQTTICGWELGKYEPEVPVRLAYATALGISLADLATIVWRQRQARHAINTAKRIRRVCSQPSSSGCSSVQPSLCATQGVLSHESV